MPSHIGSFIYLISFIDCTHTKKENFYIPANEVGGVYWNQPVGQVVWRSVCPQNLVWTTPPTVSVQFALYLAEVFIRSCRCARHTFCKNSIKNY